MNIKALTLRLPDDMHKKLKFLAVEQDTTMHEILLSIIQVLLDRRLVQLSDVQLEMLQDCSKREGKHIYDILDEIISERFAKPTETPRKKRLVPTEKKPVSP